MTHDEMRAIAEAATQAKWQAVDLDGGWYVGSPRPGNFARIDDVMAYCGAKTPANARHIATFDPPTVLALLADLAAKDARLAVLESICRSFEGIKREAEDGAEYGRKYGKEFWDSSLGVIASSADRNLRRLAALRAKPASEVVDENNRPPPIISAIDLPPTPPEVSKRLTEIFEAMQSYDPKAIVGAAAPPAKSDGLLRSLLQESWHFVKAIEEYEGERHTHRWEQSLDLRKRIDAALADQPTGDGG